jgi:peptidoglycan hydrolase FlgJ
MLSTPNASFADIAGLARVREAASRNDPAAVDEAATQFEALVIGIMLKSAREATGGDGALDGPETQQYLEIMDQQVALDMARKGGLGLGKWLAQSLRERTGASEPKAAQLADVSQRGAALASHADLEPQPRASRVAASGDGAEPAAPLTPLAFVQQLLPHARAAGERLGVPAELLIAQAALETGWGRAAPTDPQGRAANNVFGIKADGSWSGASIARPTLEYVNGVPERSSERFRAYPSLAAGFDDYARLIESSPRYRGALEPGGDPERYVRAVAAAGYSTDPAYGDKWLAVYSGATLHAAFGPPQDSTLRDDITDSAAIVAQSD